MAITAGMVKELRERTGSGMMECKRALEETNGDIDAAIEHMRKAGLAKAGKKADRTAAEGNIKILTNAKQHVAAMVEINCETDFVTKGDDFQGFANAVAACIINSKPGSLDALLALPLHSGKDTTVETARKELIAKIGENINVRRFELLENSAGPIGTYLHGDRIGVVVCLDGGSEALAKDIAMHIAATNPIAISEADVPAATLVKEKEVFMAQAADSGKPANIIEKMVEGRIRKFLAEVTLLGQPFVKDPETTIDKLLAKANAKVSRFHRFEVGEGIEKKVENFAEEVMAQAKGYQS
ncbi:MAG: elongation factor Ts [Gammaproteobacteria bacterium]|nr:elongation factor Ts [Gammaproteobacteria bacterium]